jgi:hypothetical protein
MEIAGSSYLAKKAKKPPPKSFTGKAINSLGGGFSWLFLSGSDDRILGGHPPNPPRNKKSDRRKPT